MGWAALFWLPQFWANVGPAVVVLIVLGGLCYSAGALIYALKRPNLCARWFGFHELFHVGTALGASCNFAGITLAYLR